MSRDETVAGARKDSISRRVLVDTVVAAGAWLGIAALVVHFHLFQRLYGANRDIGRWELEDLEAISITLIVVLAWFSFRRWRDARSAQTCLLQLEEDKKELNQKIRRAARLETIGKLAGGVSHEFGNILLPILSMTQVTLRKLPDDSPLRPNLEVVLEAGRQGRALIGQVKLFTGREESHPEVLDLRDAVQDGVRFSALIAPRTVNFDLDLGEDAVEIMANPADIQQALVDVVVHIAESAEPRTIGLSLDVREADRGVGSSGEPSNIRPGSIARLTVTHDGSQPPDVSVSAVSDHVREAVDRVGGWVDFNQEASGSGGLCLSFRVFDKAEGSADGQSSCG